MPQLERASDDDRLMSLVDAALAQPPGEREAWLHRECGADSQLFDQAHDYIESEERMGGFLLEPFCTLELFDPALEPGELLAGRFRIVREVGEGGMAIVYQAIDKKLGKGIAIKCAKAGFQTRLTPEVRYATEIADDHVCKIFDFHSAGTDRGEIDFITMEFLDGPTLAEKLRSGPLPENEARAIALQLCQGLAAAHGKQVIHGDLKSNNVILTKEADGSLRAVITDFGLARGIQPQPESAPPGEWGSAVGGAADYMAPELWKGENPSVASDIYALGCICYEMLSGTRLREPGGPGQESRARKPPHVHPKWDKILARCLDPDSARRYRSVEEIEKALAPRSRRVLLAAAAGVVLAVVTGAATYLRTATPPETIRLAVLPVETDTTTASLAPGLLRDTAKQIARIKSNARTRFAAVPMGRATHTLRAKLSQQNGKIVLSAHVNDERAHRNGRDWRFEYAPEELRFAPVALAGIVTAGFRLPPLTVNAGVNTAAAKDYWDGMYYLRRNSTLDKAIASMERAVTEDPASPLTFAGLAEAEWYEYRVGSEQAWLDHVMASTRNAEARNPDIAQVHRIEGYLDYSAGLYEQSQTEYRRAIELDAKDGITHIWLSKALEDSGNLDDALAEAVTAATLAANDFRTYQRLGAYYLQRSRFEEGARYHKKAVDLAPEEPNLRYNLATAYMDLGRFPEAEQELRYSIYLQQTPSANHALGLTLMYQRKESEAIHFFRNALTINAPRGGVRKYLPLLYLGIAYRRLNAPIDAESVNRQGRKLAQDDVARNPRDGYALACVAYFDAALGDRDHAQTEIAQALRLSSVSDIRWHAVLTYEILGLRESTLALLTSATGEQLADVKNWPDLADLHKNSRFLQLLGANQIRQGE